MKTLLTIILVAGFLILPHCSPVGEGVIKAHALALLCHANIWHLTGNIFCIWMLRLNRDSSRRTEPIQRILAGSSIAFLCGFLRWTAPTIGFSGAIFAMVGVMWGECLAAAHRANVTKALWRFTTMCLPWAVAGMLIPHVDGVLHTASLLAGLFYGYMARTRR